MKRISSAVRLYWPSPNVTCLHFYPSHGYLIYALALCNQCSATCHVQTSDCVVPAGSGNPAGRM